MLCCRPGWNKRPASGIALLLTVKRPPMHSDSCLRLQVHGPGWVPSLCQHCFLNALGAHNHTMRRVEKVRGEHSLEGSIPCLRKRSAKREWEKIMAG